MSSYLTQPRDEGAERSVLGSILMSRTAADDVSSVISAEDFHVEQHGRIFDAVMALHSAGSPVDVITVADELGKAGDLQRCGGHAYLHELVGCVSTPTSASFYAQIVSDKATLRRLEAAGARIVNAAQSEAHVDEVSAFAQSVVLEASDGGGNDDGDGVDEALETLDHRRFVPTPWEDMNDVIAGWTPGHLYVIGARPSIGKTRFGTNVALDAARRGWKVIFFSMEMPKSELVLQMLSSIGGVDGGRIVQRELTSQDRAAMDRAAEEYRRLGIVVDPRPGLTLAQMRAKVRQVRSRHDNVLVVWDYLTLARGSDRRADRRVQVDEIAQDAKEMAKTLDVPVIALAQLNRASEHGPSTMPDLKDLRESGGIEAAADIVVLMHREKNEQVGDPRQLMCFIGKNRFGPTATLDLYFDGRLSRITDWPTLERQERTA